MRRTTWLPISDTALWFNGSRYVAATPDSHMLGHVLPRQPGVGVSFGVMDSVAELYIGNVADSKPTLVSLGSPLPKRKKKSGTKRSNQLVVFVPPATNPSSGQQKVACTGPFACFPIASRHRAIGVFGMDRVRTSSKPVADGASSGSQLTPAELRWLRNVGDVLGLVIDNARRRAALRRVEHSGRVVLSPAPATPLFTDLGNDTPASSVHPYEPTDLEEESKAGALAVMAMRDVYASTLEALRACLPHSEAEHVWGLKQGRQGRPMQLVRLAGTSRESPTNAVTFYGDVDGPGSRSVFGAGVEGVDESSLVRAAAPAGASRSAAELMRVLHRFNFRWKRSRQVLSKAMGFKRPSYVDRQIQRCA